MKAYGIRFADGRLFNAFVHTELGAATLKTHVERLVKSYDPSLPDLSAYPEMLGPLPCEIVPLLVEVRS